MSYAQHPSFHFPANTSGKIWRYMDFTKFVSILETQSLYFPRIDQLRDPYEYAVTQETVKRCNNAIRFAESFKPCIYVSCWHCNEYESAAMWRLYLKSDEGIAIQTTATRFAESFGGYEDPVYIGEVSYIDYDKDEIPEGNMYAYAMFKRISYLHEREIRAITSPHRTLPDGRRIPSSTSGPNGLPIPVNVEQLIETIYVAPTAQQWLVDLVKAVVKRYGFKAPVTQSTLDKPPYQSHSLQARLV